ncbi:MAG: glycerol-3-phosphate 1-O-acyltransferase PlsY [Victivallales bacterium]|nr:glycerol-3-phosphate 1-O-acyltransferase PlsY [Victivallales bacterium]
MELTEGQAVTAAIGIGSYLAGAVPWAYVLGKVNGIDIRDHGSGNVGATNIRRVLGWKWGVLCFLLDFLKGFTPALAAVLMVGHGRFGIDDFAVVTACLAAVAGHVWPVFLGFKGGKGVSTIAGVLLAVAPLSLLFGGVIWFLVFNFSRYVSLASISSAVFLPLSAVFFSVSCIYPLSPILQGMLFGMSFLVILRHRGNIKRLLEGTENKFERKRGNTSEKQV